eukprot:1261229-Prymnesium_polylepis.1
MVAYYRYGAAGGGNHEDHGSGGAWRRGRRWKAVAVAAHVHVVGVLAEGLAVAPRGATMLGAHCHNP